MISTPTPTHQDTPPAPTTSTPQGSVTPSALRALTLVGRTVTVPGTPYVGVCLMIDGPDWTAVSPDGKGAHLVFHGSRIASYASPVAEVKWNSPVMGLPLLSVDMADLVPGVTLRKRSDSSAQG